MALLTVTPEDRAAWLKLRADNINSTEVSALFGKSPYMTKFELWHLKKNKSTDELEDHERMKWGRRLQNPIAHGLAEDFGLPNVFEQPAYIFDSETGIGSSFDFFVGEDGILEIKNVDPHIYRDGWEIDDDGNVEAPVHIEFQVQHQLKLTGRKVAYIGVLVAGNKGVLIKREPDLAAHAAIDTAVKDFWKSIRENNPPKPDFEKDAVFISSLYNFAQPGKVLTSNKRLEELAIIYKEGASTEKAGKAMKDGAKAESLTIIGDAEKIIGSNFTISASMVSEAPMNYIRSAYRLCKFNFKKTKG